MALDKDLDRLMRLCAAGAKKDVFDACEMIDEIAKSTPNDGIRFIQIHKTGVDLVRIWQTWQFHRSFHKRRKRLSSH
jgi:hypothetical protein